MQSLVELSKNQVILNQDQEILGLFIMRGNDKVESNIKFINKVANSKTRVTLKFILFDKAEVDLESTIVIERGAHLTDTYLKIDALLMSDKAKAHIVPCMEIMEDEVKGGHGATIGMLDEMQLWYLQSRGVDKETAEKLIIEGFVRDLIEKASDQKIKDSLEKELKKLKLDAQN